MEALFEIIFEIVIEGSIAGAQSKKVPVLLRIICILICVAVFGGLFVAIGMVAYRTWSELYHIPSMIFIALDLFFIWVIVWVYKESKKRNHIVDVISQYEPTIEKVDISNIK
ncbi:MAG: hypothetical protein FWF46_02115 [Oscillospiraceae bacterium]|nr:hypothetical protein [Oscillospiraceae bacterium]